jgi:peptidoglycan/LPS O-acetylase OafA/YrhL
VILRSAGIDSGTTDTLKFASFFIVGILLAQFTPNIRRLLSRIPIPFRLAGLLLSLLFYSLGHLFPNAAKDPMIIIGASGIIAAGLYEPEISKMLRLSLFQYLGRISYSIYLLHGTILYLLVYTLYHRVPLIWLFLPLAIGVLFFSTAFYYLVEKPSIRLGQKLAKGFRSAADFSGKTAPKVTAVPSQLLGKTVLAVPKQDG